MEEDAVSQSHPLHLEDDTSSLDENNIALGGQLPKAQ